MSGVLSSHITSNPFQLHDCAADERWCLGDANLEVASLEYLSEDGSDAEPVAEIIKKRRRANGIAPPAKYEKRHHEIIKQLIEMHGKPLFSDACVLWQAEGLEPMKEVSFDRYVNLYARELKECKPAAKKKRSAYTEAHWKIIRKIVSLAPEDTKRGVLTATIAEEFQRAGIPGMNLNTLRSRLRALQTNGSKTRRYHRYTKKHAEIIREVVASEPRASTLRDLCEKASEKFRNYNLIPMNPGTLIERVRTALKKFCSIEGGAFLDSAADQDDSSQSDASGCLAAMEEFF